MMVKIPYEGPRFSILDYRHMLRDAEKELSILRTRHEIMLDAIGGAIDAFRIHGLTMTAQFKTIEKAYSAAMSESDGQRE